MTEHFCVKHQTPFFKKGKMRGYAHPIVDEEGKPTGEWCNEPDEEPKPAKVQPAEKIPIPKDTKPEKSNLLPAPSREDSIESQTAYKGLIELMVAGIIKPEDNIGKRVLAWGLVRLGKMPPDIAQAITEASQSKTSSTPPDDKEVADWKKQFAQVKDSKVVAGWLADLGYTVPKTGSYSQTAASMKLEHKAQLKTWIAEYFEKKED